MIIIKNLSKSYSTKKILANINLTFEQGKIYGIVGENGAGKTTLFNCIAGLEKFEGSIVCEEYILKNNLGLLQTEPWFLSKITGKEYLQLLCNARQINIDNFKDQNVFDLPLNQYAETYSSGMKKKLALTAILLQNNQAFILDEPFNGVDIQSNFLIKQIILRLKALNKIVILSSHIFATLTETCDSIHLLKNNTIIKTVVKDGFMELEKEMSDNILGDKLEKLLLK